MRLTKASVEKFRQIYKKRHGEELSYEKAEEMGRELLEFYTMIMPKI